MHDARWVIGDSGVGSTVESALTAGLHVHSTGSHSGSTPIMVMDPSDQLINDPWGNGSVQQESAGLLSCISAKRLSIAGVQLHLGAGVD